MSSPTSNQPALILASTGNYPRIGDSPELQILRRAIAAADRGERTAADLAEAEDEMTRRAIEDQVRAGLELITDGQIRWYDPISHLAGKLAGVQIKGLTRFFDTNFYFRQPILTARPKRKGAMVTEEFSFARHALDSLLAKEKRGVRASLKAVLTGPYTLAKSSLAGDSGMNSLETRAEAYAEALAAEVGALAGAGAEFIQVDEPAIVKYPNDWETFARALGHLCEARDTARQAGKRLGLALYVYFGNCAPIYEKLASLPVDVLGVDFTYNPGLVDVVAAIGSPIPLGLGLLDGRNTKLEDPSGIARQIEKLLPRIEGRRAYLGTSCGLEYLPRDRAYAKLKLLEKIRARVRA